jgi:hypothetical protein
VKIWASFETVFSAQEKERGRGYWILLYMARISCRVEVFGMEGDLTKQMANSERE